MSCECKKKLADPAESVEHEFNYENAKIAFHQELGYVLQDKRLTSKVVHKVTDIDKIIHDIQLKKVLYKSYFTTRCQIVNENGKSILGQVCKIKRKVDNIKKLVKGAFVKQFISLDELFDVMSELHMQEPSLTEEEMHIRLSNCVLPLPLISLFRKSCETCNSTMKNIDSSYDVVCEMCIFGFDLSDGKFTNILLYIERNTNFVLLRPLQSVSDNEVAYELVTIFADFGIPSIMDSNNFCTERYNSILNILKSVEPPFDVPSVFANSRRHKVTLAASWAKIMIRDWMTETGSSNWAIGAHIVQWQMNTNKVIDSYIRSRVVCGPISSPYHAMFSLLPRTHLVQINKKRQSGSTLRSDKFLLNCSQCNLPIYKIFKCYFCKQQCHFTCCIRFVEQALEVPILINKCFSCVNSDLSNEEMILGT